MDSPQAFPGYRYNGTTDGVEQVGNQTYRCPGMTLRDYFAASIIAGLYVSYRGNPPEPEQMAEDAYAIADAMLEARAAPTADVRIPTSGAQVLAMAQQFNRETP